MDLVKCVVKYVTNDLPIVIPLIDHPHSDKENGQPEVHYHIDTKYIGCQNHLRNYKICTFEDLDEIRFDLNNIFKTIPLRKRHLHQIMSTNPELIKNSKLKHKCIKNGKCPHRGMDLSKNKPNKNGEIICPLHSLKFDAISKKLIEK